MSLHGYDALRIEFPSRLLADGVAAGLAICSALTIEAVAARYPEPRMGLGIAALALLAAWLWYRRRGAAGVTGITVDRDGSWQTVLADGRSLPSQVLPGTRLLGSTVALRWRVGTKVRHAWLTPRDVPAPQLRELAVRLAAARVREGA